MHSSHKMGQKPRTFHNYHNIFPDNYKMKQRHARNFKNKMPRSSIHADNAYMTNITLQEKNSSPASNLELGWVIDSGASAHMTPFRTDCYNIRHTYKQIYLADGSSILCNQMGAIDIPIRSKAKDIGKLILEDVLIVPNLDRRLFSVSSFLSKGNNWVNFTKDQINLGIKHGPTINLPITSLQSNAFVVDHCQNKTPPKHYAFDDGKSSSLHANRTTCGTASFFIGSH